MSYPDLQHEVAERVRPPAFEDVLARAADARRRRRTTIGSGLAASLVVGGLAFAIGEPGRPDGRSSEPAGTTRNGDTGFEVDPRLPAEVREVLSAEDVVPWVVSGSGDATAAVIRASCDYSLCPSVVVTRRGDEVAGVALDSDATALTPVPGGWVMDGAADDPRLLTEDGELRDLRPADVDPSAVEAGDTAVSTGDGPRLLRADLLLPVPAPAGGVAHNAYVTPAGGLVVVTFLQSQLMTAASDDGRTWRTSPLDAATPTSEAAAFVAGHGEDVAVAVLDYSADGDGSIPVLGVQVSRDAGRTWLAARTPDDLSNLSAMAVSPQGTTYLTTESHGLVRIDNDGRATLERRTSSHDTSVFTDDERVCLIAEAGPIDRLQCSTDDGTTWEPEPLPGFR